MFQTDGSHPGIEYSDFLFRSNYRQGGVVLLVEVSTINVSEQVLASSVDCHSREKAPRDASALSDYRLSTTMANVD